LALSDKGFAEDSIDIISASWRESTIKQYQYAWKLWSNWCISHSIDPINSSVQDLLNFLSVQFKLVKSYSILENTLSTSQVTEYLGSEGFKFANPLKNLFTNRCWPTGTLSTLQWILEIDDLYVFKILYDFTSLNCTDKKFNKS
jgi:hypothetical protein